MIRLFYNLAWPIGLLFVLPRYLVKMFRRGGYRENFGQRLALYDPAVVEKLSNRSGITWIHAVSVGELAVAVKIARELREIDSAFECMLTTTTTTAYAFARKNAPEWAELMYMPLDFWPIMRRAFKVIRPGRIVLVEGEVWPNLMARAAKSNIPVALANARLSPRSHERFTRFRRYVAPIFRGLDLVCVPALEDVEKWRALGVFPERIHHTGSVKYDSSGLIAQTPANEARVFHLSAGEGELVLLGGSTHAGEEEILGRVFRRLRERFPTLTLVVAPRHVERVEQVRRRLEAMSFTVRRKTEAASHPEDRPDCILFDTTGELSRWYSIATVVFIGKSLTAHGGQNPVEPIVARVPVVFGPNMQNFEPLATQLVGHRGAMLVRDELELAEAVEKLLGDGELRRRSVASAEEVLLQHRGATRRTAELVRRLPLKG